MNAAQVRTPTPGSIRQVVDSRLSGSPDIVNVQVVQSDEFPKHRSIQPLTSSPSIWNMPAAKPKPSLMFGKSQVLAKI